MAVLQKSSMRSLQSLSFLKFQNNPLHSAGMISIVNQCPKKLETKCCIHTTPRICDSSSSKPKILNQSSLLVQDGIGFEELPILIRRSTKDCFPFTSHSYTGNTIKEESQFDVSFRQTLQGCDTVSAVFKLLEVPHDHVEGYSAAFALQRLHELKHLNTEWTQIHSFIRSAVMRELYMRVQSDVKLLSTSTLLSLIECYMAADGFSTSCMDAINVEIQVRLADNALSIFELMDLSAVLKTSLDLSAHPRQFSGEMENDISSAKSSSKYSFKFQDEPECEKKLQPFDKFSAKDGGKLHEERKRKCQELMENVWIHLMSRYSEIDEETLPVVLQALPFDRRNCVSLLERPATNVWTELSPEGVQTCLDNLARLQLHNAGIMTHLGRWAYVHIHEMTPELLRSYLHTFSQFSFLDESLITVLEKCLQLRGEQAQTDVLAMSVDYCTTCRYLSPVILDVAANHLTLHGDSYNPVQLYAVLRAFGYLNYLPTKSTAFLKKAETCMWNHFDNMPERQILELLGSLTFLNILPKNFDKRVNSAYFYTKIGELKSPDKAVSLMWLRVLKHSVALDLSRDIQVNFQWILEQRNTRSVFVYLDSHKVAITALRQALNELVGSDYSHVLPFYGCCALYLDKDGMPLMVTKDPKGYKINGEIHKKLVLMLRSADHFTVNTGQLLGAQAQRTQNLSRMGFQIVEIRSSHLLFYSHHSGEILRQYLTGLVSPAGLASSVRTEDASKELENSCHDRDWLSYVNDAAIISDDDSDGID